MDSLGVRMVTKGEGVDGGDGGWRDGDDGDGDGGKKESSSESLWNHCQITVQIISGITGESLKMYI